jgi:hypothetical protein
LSFLQVPDAGMRAQFGILCAKVRQVRRAMRKEFESLSARLKRDSFDVKRAAWRNTPGRTVCRHGVFFTRSSADRACPCMLNDPSPELWRHARYMACISYQLRAIVTTRFELGSFRRLGILQAEMRRRSW